MMRRAMLLILIGAGLLEAQVSFDRIIRSGQEPQNWLTHSGNYNSQRYSTLSQITPENAKNLELQWLFQARSLEKFEATPLVVDGIMYTVQAPNDIVALDASTGRMFWTYSYTPAPEARPCCGRVNRGLAILGDTLFMATIDARLIAVDAKNGRPLWNTAVAKPEAGYAMTVAPLVIKDKVIIGTAGGEFGIRGFIAAYDAKTGKDAWQHGGASVWVTGSYDPDLNLTYWGIGNPGPDYNGDDRTGDNLYACSVVALDADTGKLKWYYQFSPHDEFDYDSTQVPVLADIQWQGSTRKVMMWANRNGFFYVLDRATGEFLLGKPFVEVNWASGFDAKGRPIRVAGMLPNAQGVLILPGNQGGTNWYNPSFSPKTGLFYIPTWANYSSLYTKEVTPYEEGARFNGGTPRPTIPTGTRTAINNYAKEDEGYGAIRAIDPHTGEMKWQFKMTDFTDAGVLTTASNVLFSGGREGYFYALDARDGKLLWKFPVGGRVISGPMTFSLGGRQYVGISAGNSLFAFALKQ